MIIREKERLQKEAAQKIRDYFKTPKWKAFTKKQKERHGRI
jgi:hypothetical protein